MIDIVHLTDDPGLGGVNRTLAVLMQNLHASNASRQMAVDPISLPVPRLAADVAVVHFTMSWRKLCWVAALRARNRDTTFVLVEHSYTRSFEALHVPNRPRFRLMLRLACALMDQIVCVSAAQAAWLAEAARVPPAKIRAINPHTDLSALRALKPPPEQHRPLRLGAYGRYVPQKGFDVLIEAMRLVPPDIATLCLAGLGPLEAAFRSQAAALPHVRIQGVITSPAEFLGGVDAVVLPSRFEAFGNVGLEARAAARPIIVTDVDGLQGQALPHPELCVPPEEPRALAQSILWLAAQDISRLGAEARASADGAEQHTIDGWNRLFQQLDLRCSQLNKRKQKAAGPLSCARR
jgi:glycosyltransferase involved in cell wall biosynthesis